MPEANLGYEVGISTDVVDWPGRSSGNDNMFLPLVILIVVSTFQASAKSPKIKCQKEAEAFAIAESKKSGHLPPNLLSLAHPTEMDGDDVVVYVGARANYNYFKLKVGRECHHIEIVESEYAR